MPLQKSRLRKTPYSLSSLAERLSFSHKLHTAPDDQVLSNKVMNSQVDGKNGQVSMIRKALSFSLPDEENINWIRIAIVFFLLIVTSFATYLSTHLVHLPKNLDLMLHFAVASVVILLANCVLNFSAYRFFEDPFYLFLSLGWFANSLYILFEALFPKLRSSLDYNIFIFALSSLSLIPFYIAGFIHKHEPTEVRRILKVSSLWVVLFIINSLVYVWVVTKWPGLDAKYKFMVFVIGGIIFATYTLIRIGIATKSRVDRKNYRRYAALFRWSFYLFGSIQFMYIFKMNPDFYFPLVLAFSAALVFKIINGVSVINIISYGSEAKFREYYEEVQDQLTQKSILEDIGALTASIEHDIRNPLGVMENEIDTMLEKFQSYPEITKRLRFIDEQRKRIFAVTEIIPLLRGDKAFYEKFMEKFSLNALIIRAIKDVSAEMNTSNIRFVHEDRVLYVKCNRRLIEQALVNILKNAVEAIRESKKTNGIIRIETAIDTRRNNLIRVDICDNGAGIPEENLPKITMPLFTTRMDRKPNSGLGLFISDRILRIHSGKLEFTSQIDKGTTVSIFLPKWQDKKMQEM